MSLLKLLKNHFWGTDSHDVQPPVSKIELPEPLRDFVVIDVETTGLSPKDSEIIQLSAVRYRDGREIESFASYIHPSVHIPSRITEITGIRDSTVRNAPSFASIQKKYFDFIEKSPVVTGYNVSFDLRFLSAASGIPLSSKWLYFDTLEYVRLCDPGLPEYKLGSVCAHIGYRTNFHDALNDCRACGSVLFYLCETSFDLLNDFIALHNPVGPENLERVSWNEWCDNGQIFYVRGEDERKAGNFETAIKYYEKAKECKCVYPFLYNSYAMVYRKQMDYINEIKILEEGIVRLGEDVGRDLVVRKEKAMALLSAKEKSERIEQARAQRREERAARKLREQETVVNKPKQPQTRPILQMDDSGIVLREFPSVSAAAQTVGVSQKCIRDAANGKQKHASGFCWKYKVTEQSSSAALPGAEGICT